MLSDNRKIRDVCTLVKFRVNLDNPHSKNRILTKTLGKVGFINAQYRGIAPSDEDFWLASIDSMVTKGAPSSGIFVLTPIKSVHRDDIMYLTHGMYTYEDDAGVRYVFPKHKNAWWVMSLQDRRLLFDEKIHAIVIVNHDHDPATSLKNASQDVGVERLNQRELDHELGLRQTTWGN